MVVNSPRITFTPRTHSASLLLFYLNTLPSQPLSTTLQSTKPKNSFHMFAISFIQPSLLASDIKSSKITSPFFSRKISTTENRVPCFSRKISATAENRVPCSRVTKMGSLYEVLGISTGASCLEIKTAYRSLARTCHPDVVAMNQKESSANQFMMIHLAYSTLSDPNKRSQYDREIYGHRSVVSVSARNKTYARVGRKWETDQCW